MLTYLASIFILANIVTINSAEFLDDKVCVDCKFVGVEVKAGIDFKSLAQIPLPNSTHHNNNSTVDQVLIDYLSLIVPGIVQMVDLNEIAEKSESELKARNLTLCSLCVEYHSNPEGYKLKLAIEVFQLNVCTRLGYLEQACRDLSEKHPNIILGYLFDKNTDCSNFCLRNTTLKSEVNDLIASMKLNPKTKNMFQADKNKMVKRDIKEERVKNDAQLCEVCTNIVSEIHDFVNQNLTAQQIIDLVENVCNQIPLVGKICKTFIETNVQNIIDLINKNVDPDIICQGFCNKTRTEKTISFLSFLDSTRTSEIQCEVCVFNAELTRITLKQYPADRHQLRNLFEQILRLFPANLRSQWFSYLNENDGVFIELLGNNVDSRTTCRSIKQCYGTTSAKYVAPYDSI